MDRGTVILCPYCGAENIPGADTCDECLEDLTHLDRPRPGSAVERSLMRDPLSALQPPVPQRVAPDAPVEEVVRAMVGRHIGAILVWEGDNLVGIFSERDLIVRLGDRYHELKDRPIREFMTPKPEVLRINDTIAYALNRMDVGDYRHLPILDDTHSYPTGIIAVRDILFYIASQYPELMDGARSA